MTHVIAILHHHHLLVSILSFSCCNGPFAHGALVTCIFLHKVLFHVFILIARCCACVGSHVVIDNVVWFWLGVPHHWLLVHSHILLLLSYLHLLHLLQLLLFQVLFILLLKVHFNVVSD